MIGVFQIGAQEPNSLSPRQIEMVQTFADQAVVAVENARLFNEVQAKTRDLEDLPSRRRLPRCSRSSAGPRSIWTRCFKTLNRSARSLSSAAAALVFVRDDELMRIRAESGCSRALVEYAQAHPVRAGRETFVGRVMLTGEIVHIPDVLGTPTTTMREGRGWATTVRKSACRSCTPAGWTASFS